MSVTLPYGVTLTFEVAMSTGAGGYGLWGSGRWGEFRWGPGTVWTDLSTRVRSASVDRSFSRELESWRTGTATVVTDNRDGNLSPDNLTGTYAVSGVTQIRPARPSRLRAGYAGVTYGLVRGSAADLEERRTRAPAGAGDASVAWRLEDAWADLATDGAATTPAGAGELSGARMSRILGSIGYTGDLALDAGVTTLQATDLARGVQSEIDLTVRSEGGAAWIDRDGVLRFDGRYALAEKTRSNTVQATFGDGGGSEIPYRDAQTSYDRSQVVNVATYTRVGGTPQTAADSVSRAVYGMRRDTRTGLLCETDGQVLSLARWRIARSSAPEKRFTKIVVHPRRNPAVMFPIVLGLEVRDLVRVISRPPGGYTMTRDCHIAGIHHQITPKNWTTTLDLWSASPYAAITTSRWGVGKWGEFRWAA